MPNPNNISTIIIEIFTHHFNTCYNLSIYKYYTMRNNKLINNTPIEIDLPKGSVAKF